MQLLQYKERWSIRMQTWQSVNIRRRTGKITALTRKTKLEHNHNQKRATNNFAHESSKSTASR